MFMGPHTRREGYSWQKEKTLKINRSSWICWPPYGYQKKLAIIHCPGHQKAETPIARGNQKADQTAREVAL
jgi:hypothetical protein